MSGDGVKDTMNERPPAERALFDRVIRLLKRSREQTPATPADVAKLNDLDAALSLCVVLCTDIDRITFGGKDVKYCGHCRAHDITTAQRFESVEAVQAHIVQCERNPMMRAIRELEEKLRDAEKQAKEFFALLTPQQIEDWRHR